MQTDFSLAQLADPDTAESEKILRTCVHCGFCTATCPTYVLLGDELDSPRGRIYLIKNMLETGGPVGAETVKHIDRCLSCLAGMTTCPSGVHYMNLVDHGRRRIETHYRRPCSERLLQRPAPPAGRRGALPGIGPRQYRRLGTRTGERRVRRDRRQRLGLRHDAEGLRLSAARGPHLCRKRGAARSAHPRRQRGGRRA